MFQVVGIKLVILKYNKEISFSKALEIFNFYFTSLENDTLFDFTPNLQYLYLNKDVKIVKISFQNNVIFETNDFMSLFK